MAITHNWKITKLIQLNNETGTICKVQYMLKSIDGDLVAENGGNIELETENVENFVYEAGGKNWDEYEDEDYGTIYLIHYED